MRLLVLGGWGQLGTDLHAAAVEAGHEVVRPRSAEVDVTRPDQVRAVAGTVRPDVVVNAAAFHRVDVCEAQPERALAVNAAGALHVARVAHEQGARCVFVSTDYVFGGDDPDGYDEDAPPAPVNVYGASKMTGERLVSQGCPDSLVVRASGLFGHAGSSGKGGNFVETMLAKGAAGEHLAVVDDVVFCPTSTEDLADRILLLLDGGAPPGVYHAANAGATSWFGFAREIFREAGIGADVEPTSSDDIVVRRPRCSVLLDTRTRALGLPPMRPWQEALARYLAHRT